MAVPTSRTGEQWTASSPIPRQCAKAERTPWPAPLGARQNHRVPPTQAATPGSDLDKKIKATEYAGNPDAFLFEQSFHDASSRGELRQSGVSARFYWVRFISGRRM